MMSTKLKDRNAAHKSTLSDNQSKLTELPLPTHKRSVLDNRAENITLD